MSAFEDIARLERMFALLEHENAALKVGLAKAEAEIKRLKAKKAK